MGRGRVRAVVLSLGLSLWFWKSGERSSVMSGVSSGTAAAPHVPAKGPTAEPSDSPARESPRPVRKATQAGASSPVPHLISSDNPGSGSQSAPAAGVGSASVVSGLRQGRFPGEVLVNPVDGLQYAWIPPGAFEMGCSPGDGECEPAEISLHHVTITNGFWIGTTEVTVRAFRRFLQSPQEAADDNNRPIANVSWNEASQYCRWAGGSLPTEAEWEYAARGGSESPRYGTLGSIAWFWENSGGQPHTIGMKTANVYKLYDMLGNIAEWCSDWYSLGYEGSSEQNPQGAPSGESRVVRGGSWMSTSREIRASYRYGYLPQNRYPQIGFRCVKR